MAWVFPNSSGEPRVTGSIGKPRRRALKAAKISHRVTGHGLRRTFNELASQSDKTGITTRAITGHSDVGMQEHYREVPTAEKRELQISAMADVF